MLDLLLSLRVLYFILFLINFTQTTVENEFCDSLNEYEENNNKCNVQSRYSRNRYILYDVNPVEGFNLRRDVYIRTAIFIKNLIEENKEFKWQLVLPPWGNLYHWRSKHIGSQAQLPWGLFFDIASLQKYVPVIEMYQFLQEYPSENEETNLDIVYILQNDDEMFKTGIFKDKNEIIKCNDKSLQFHKVESNKYVGYFWGYHNVTSKVIKCVKYHGTVLYLKQNLKPNVYRSVMFDHMEIALHDLYGTKEYWSARRSMRYNSELYDIANEFRKNFLNSTDEHDKTNRPKDWTKEENKRDAIGGPYLSVHLRRRDFLIGRSATVPTIKSAASKLKKKLKKLQLNLLFVATDAVEEEFNELKGYLSDYTVFRFIPSDYVLNKFKDGGIAIIDQIICSYARYFIGTHESTFTFRIQEDREIIGFSTTTTFNHLCKGTEKCDSTGQWEIVW
ncbi:GDP-fucose protein O-fucosyltransferase 2 [Habropoda laboriosa]|uniref:GDP-fucose protein O-fucosyltransferase 2 n=1 Tax=Habropoda laboriosa TaxID=597456 RepID=A0A0L7RCT4_9HYME|nr:PREDICTED: GDP-fucose protein O-fucosyltransferase 2 [Habropoda laboriosa]KOC68600.1 GDP-fucose protein O-fucosyltransferase 2 [Habropoda laboriosa]